MPGTALTPARVGQLEGGRSDPACVSSGPYRWGITLCRGALGLVWWHDAQSRTLRRESG